jgi:hypothetical protein
MSVVELRDDDGAAHPVSAGEPASVAGGPDRVRPNVAGDLPSLFRAEPMFRRAVAGYDRFQVDSYVQWAEDELATADRQLEHLVTRQLTTQAELDEARELLSHSSSGGDFLQLSRRMGALLATAADEAESLRVDAEADRSARAEEAARIVARATETLAGARSEAERLVHEATADAAATAAQAELILQDAERTGSEARAEAEARLAEVRDLEQLALEEAAALRAQAAEHASTALLAARAEVVRMLSTGREERRRADEAAVVAREFLDRDAHARRASLIAEIAVLEQRVAALRALEPAAQPAARNPRRTLETHLHELLGKLRLRSGSLRHP